jgi:preprotein translocase subunit SecG
MYILLTVIHVLISIVLCVAVLMQSGKGGGLAGAFGGGGGAPQQMLGSRGVTTLLHKVTIWAGIGFMVTSLVLFMMSGSGPTGGGSILEDAQEAGQINPDLPAPPVTEEGMMPPPSPGEGDGTQGAADQPAPGGGNGSADTPEGGGQ